MLEALFTLFLALLPLGPYAPEPPTSSQETAGGPAGTAAEEGSLAGGEVRGMVDPDGLRLGEPSASATSEP
jgi:hypothetical protein